MDPLKEFWSRVHEEWLPIFCNARGYPLESFDASKKVISARDVADFLRAQSILTVNERGEFSMPQSKAKEVIFWDGDMKSGSKRLPLWVEPIVTIAAVARLHFDYGWPVELLGMQSVKWQFDLTGFLPGDLVHEHIAGEVKSSSKQLDNLMAGLRRCCTQADHDCSQGKGEQQNAHKKWQGLMRSRAPMFWAVAPDGDSRVYQTTYNDDGTIVLTSVAESFLRFPC